MTLNPAATRLVPPPEVSSQPAGRALTSKEVRYLLAGPDRDVRSSTLCGYAEQAPSCALVPSRRSRNAATPLHRPEDCEIGQSDNSVFIALTNNPARANLFGHIVRLIEDKVGG
jgi:secreted PhoX family phosphatase